MGQKVNPTGFRLGITTDHRSRWFADSTKPGQRYRDFVEKEVIGKSSSKTVIDKCGTALIFC